MATTFEVIFLGTLAQIDTVQENETVENAHAILGTYGTAQDPLSARVATLSADRLSEDDNDSYDLDNGGGYDSFRINGGPSLEFDASAVYNATITYSDGTTAHITAVILQDVHGNTFLAPEETQNADQIALTAKPIQSLTLSSVFSSGGDLPADRFPGNFMSSVDGTNGNDLMEVGYTDAQGDQITHGADAIYGGGGHDRIVAGGGADTVYGGDGNDDIFAEGGDDIVYGGSGNDTIDAWSGNDLVYAGAGDDVVNTSTGNDTIFMDEGNDTVNLWDNAGHKVLSGGAGEDKLDFQNWQSGQGANVTFTGDATGTFSHFNNQTTGTFSSFERISGTSFDDAMDASATSSGVRLDGEAGDDVLIGGAGDDTLTGGDGTDTAFFTGPVSDYSFDYGSEGQLIVIDSVAGRDGTDRLTDVEYLVFDGVTYRLVQGDDWANTTLQGPDDGTSSLIIAHDGADWGGGHATSDAVFGGAGNDTLDGGDGDDTLVGEGDDDLLRGDGGNDALFGGEGNDTLQGGAGDDALFGGDGDDTAVFSGPVEDYSFDFGPEGQLIVTDSVDGRDGTDTLDGMEFVTFDGTTYRLIQGDDASNTTLQGPNDGIPSLIIAHDGADWGGGHATSDAVFGGAGDDTLDGGDGDDTLVGEDGNDLLRGDGGADVLFGGGGNDTLQGGDGDDTLTGGDGADRFVLLTGGGTDRITDFDTTVIDGRAIDQLDVSDLRNAEDQPVTLRDVIVGADQEGNAVLFFPGGEQVVLEGVAPNDVQSKQQLSQIGIPCFATGTQILTPEGFRPVEHLRPGDTVTTAQSTGRVIWAAQTMLSQGDLAARPDYKPVHFPVHAIGNTRPLRLSPQHAIRMQNARGEDVLVRAKHLAEIAFGGARVAKSVSSVGYYHILLERHAILNANGAPTESFYPGPQAIQMLDWSTRLGLAAALLSVTGTTAPVAERDLWLAYGPRIHPVASARQRHMLSCMPFYMAPSQRHYET